MGVYIELFTGGRAGGPREHYVELYEQPAKQHMRAELYHLWERKTWRALKVVEPFFRKRHEQQCTGCAPGYREGQTVMVCTYIPLTNRQDLRCYEMHRRDRRELVRVTLTKNEYENVAAAMN